MVMVIVMAEGRWKVGENIKEEKQGPAPYRSLSRLGVPCIGITDGPGF